MPQPVAEFRTYPVYRPDREPAGYMDWWRKQDQRPLVAPEEIKSDADWVKLGERVFDELDVFQFRTDNPKAIDAIRSRARSAAEPQCGR